MTIHAVIGGVELAFEEPSVVAVEEGAAVYGLKIFGPGEEGTRLTRPVFVWVGDGFFVEGLVFFEACCGREGSGFAAFGGEWRGKEVGRTTDMRFAWMLCKVMQLVFNSSSRTQISFVGKAENRSQGTLTLKHLLRWIYTRNGQLVQVL
jgi:hypothetical protein